MDSPACGPPDAQPDKHVPCQHLQKIHKLEHLLPHKNIQQIRQSFLHNLKFNLNHAVLAQDDSLRQWINAFNEFLDAFGFSFTKEEHILFVKICLTALDSIEYDFILMRKLIKILMRLIKKTHLLSREDLEIDWRLLYRLVEKTHYSSNYRNKTLCFELGFYSDLMKLVCYSRVYFNKQATSEMLSEWKQYLCVYSNKYAKYVHCLALFLPTLVHPDEHEFGFKLWFEDFIKQWSSSPTSGTNPKLMNQNNVFLFALLAQDANGFIDWDPYMPVIFERFIKYFHVDARKSQSSSLEIKFFAQWIVYMISPNSKCLDHLKQFFRLRSVNFFIASTKSDSLFRSVVTSLLDYFIKRYRNEHYKKNWHNFTPKTHLLTEEIVHDFASIMVDVVEKINLSEFDIENLYKLSLISSDILSQKVMQKLELAYEQISEPARLVSALQTFSLSLHPIVTNKKLGSEYRSYIIPMLTNLTSSINTNDHMLCYLQLFTIRSIVVLGIPLQDCSNLANADDTLDEITTQMLLDSQQLEDFCIQFLNCCLAIIESNNEDLFKLNKKGLSMKRLLEEIFVNVLANMSPKNMKLIIDKVFAYATSHIFENEESCNILEKLIHSCFLLNPSYSMDNFFLTVSRNIKTTIENKTSLADICKSELIYNLRLLYACLNNDGKALVKHQDETVELFSVILRVDYEDNHELITKLLAALFANLTRFHLVDEAFIASNLNSNDDKSKLSRFVNWPFQVDIKQLPLNWHVPDQSEIDFARNMITSFILPEMATLEAWADSKVELNKFQLTKSLSIILSFRGFKYALPNFSKVSNANAQKYLNEDIFILNLFGEANFRDNLMSLMQKVINRLYTIPDNVSHLLTVIKILDGILFPYNSVGSNVDFDLKKIYQPLSNEHVYIPSVHYSRMNNYYPKLSSILKSMSNSTFTPSHHSACEQLFSLSTCSYSKVRTFAQLLFVKLSKKFPDSVNLILPQLANNLKNIENYDAFKGTLYLLIGNLSESILLSPNWNFLIHLWPILVKANFAEKPKIANMFDFQFLPLISSYFVTIPIKRSSILHNLDASLKKSKIAGFRVPDENEVKEIELSIGEWSRTNEGLYHQLVGELLQTLDENKLHWRFYNLGLYFLNLLIRYDCIPSRQVIQVFLDNLVHESIHIRKTAVIGLKKILFLIKPKKLQLKIEFENISYESLELNYLHNEESFAKAIFHDKAHAGYYDVAYTSSKATSNELYYQFIVEQFQDETYLDKLFDLYSVEHSKTIDRDFVKIWKYLYQSFQLFNNESIFPRIEQILSKDKHSHDKLAVEIMSGLVKSSSSFNYADMSTVKSFLAKIVDKHLTSFNSESYNLWSYFVTSFFINRDIRRSLWLFECLFTETLFLETTSPYYQAAYLNFLVPVLSNNWRFPQISQNVISKLEENLNHPYHNVRLAIANLLSSLFYQRVRTNLPENDRINFSHRVEAQLGQAMSSLFVESNSLDNMAVVKSGIFDNDSVEGKHLLNVIETICNWVVSSFNSKLAFSLSDFITLLPYLCLVQSTSQLVQDGAQKAITKIASQIYSNEQIESILSIIDQITNNWNWHSRKQILVFMQRFIYSNIFALSQNEKWTDFILNVISRLLKDEVIEVRESACLTLSSFVIWDIVKPTRLEALVSHFKTESMRKVRQIRSEDGQRTMNGNDIRVKHGAILGLCAFIYSCPDSLPDSVIPLLLLLAEHLSDPQPIPKSITAALNTFKKFHLQNWIVYKQKFSLDQLSELNNILISPSYYA